MKKPPLLIACICLVVLDATKGLYMDYHYTDCFTLGCPGMLKTLGYIPKSLPQECMCDRSSCKCQLDHLLQETWIKISALPRSVLGDEGLV